MLSNLYNEKTHDINWDYVWSIPEFNILKTTEHSRKWHKEGCVANHVIKVVEAMDKSIPYTNENAQLRKIMMLSALFHDIGKGVTTYFNKEKNDWSATGHAEEGDIITRKLLKDESFEMRETICYFVRNHMKPLYVCESPLGIRDIITMSCDSIFTDFCNLKNLIILKKCDCEGSIFDDYDDWREKLEFAKELAIELDCYEKPYHFENEMSKYYYFNQSAETMPKTVEDTSKFNVIILIGESDNFVQEHTNYALLTDEDKNGDIVDTILDYCENKQSFIMNINELNDDCYDYFFQILYDYDASITFAYNNCETFITPTLSMNYIISE